MTALPTTAAWRHRDAREGFEVLFISGRRFEGHTVAVEDGVAWVVSYRIEVDDGWRTRRALVSGHSGSVEITADGAGHWRVDGEPRPELDGCLDLDLESSAFTNAFPVHRLALAAGIRTQADAAYVRAVDLSVERLEQHYTRLENSYDYESPRHDFRCEITYDGDGLVLDYPGIAVRVA